MDAKVIIVTTFLAVQALRWDMDHRESRGVSSALTVDRRRSAALYKFVSRDFPQALNACPQ